MAEKKSFHVAQILWAIILVSVVGCGADHDPGSSPASLVEATEPPPYDLFFEGLDDPEMRLWNRSANDWIVVATDSVAFYFEVRVEPLPEGACGILVRAGEANRVRLGECLTTIEYVEPFDPCFAKKALATVLGVEADTSTCDVTEAEENAVVARWGKPWAVTILPASP